MDTIGILAYGSLIDDAGEEIDPLITRRIEEDVVTPFNVEFARKSSSRDEAPTLIPVRKGGAQVKAVILVLANAVSEKEAEDMLWRRETNNIGTSKSYNRPPDPKPDNVLIERIKDLHGVGTVLYTRIGSNIDDLAPGKLARYAIDSANAGAGARGRDGISYLLDAKSNGIETPLMPEYEKEILRKTSTNSLVEALESIRRVT